MLQHHYYIRMKAGAPGFAEICQVVHLLSSNDMSLSRIKFGILAFPVPLRPIIAASTMAAASFVLNIPNSARVAPTIALSRTTPRHPVVRGRDGAVRHYRTRNGTALSYVDTHGTVRHR
ncbi:hypothetical protein Vretimale_10255 [Volvox reticuliferus]|uniref:Uncharacterized protein n=1 Tax=Volvox reticuliferus TaxID=1737510 RepID=A0A8J4GE95_9CHLO|nr:hypothetical protein Vretimale_10255 [Volvox reticuliferus]